MPRRQPQQLSFFGSPGGYTERHFCHNLSGLKEKDKSFLLDAPLLPSSLFGDSVG